VTSDVDALLLSFSLITTGSHTRDKLDRQIVYGLRTRWDEPKFPRLPEVSTLWLSLHTTTVKPMQSV